ncbi:MAG: phosphatidylserine decarboxylase family protein [Deltaproteobacteria bacterium]|nr:MAG: phosphatidylserine decarboxylase family protein [Deltaproteobacteria bacterium]
MDKYSWSEPPSQTAFPVAKAGYPYIFASAFATAVVALTGLTAIALIGILVTFFIAFFFRDPDRIISTQKGLVVSPADGKVISVGTVDRSIYYEGTALKISIFMSVFNVHVNRIPFEGRVTKIGYQPGRFLAANLDKASKYNERNAIFLETEDQKKICAVQIAGLVARRIICNLKEGDTVARGQRFGMICFGSRVDVYLPADSKLTIAVGDVVRAGTSVLGELK